MFRMSLLSSGKLSWKCPHRHIRGLPTGILSPSRMTLNINSCHMEPRPLQQQRDYRLLWENGGQGCDAFWSYGRVGLLVQIYTNVSVTYNQAYDLDGLATPWLLQCLHGCVPTAHMTPGLQSATQCWQHRWKIFLVTKFKNTFEAVLLEEWGRKYNLNICFIFL